VEAAGIEPLPSSTGNTNLCPQGGAESGALGEPGNNGPIDAAADTGLLAVIQAWPHLPQAIQAGILAIVRASN
jgi:hypothetical protein